MENDPSKIDQQYEVSPQQKRLYILERHLYFLKQTVRAPERVEFFNMATRALQAAYSWPVLGERLISEAEHMMEHAVECAMRAAAFPRVGPKEHQHPMTCQEAISYLHYCEFLTETEANSMYAWAEAFEAKNVEEAAKHMVDAFAERRRRVRNGGHEEE